MFRAIAAIALASASAQPSSSLLSTNSWWERVTVTVNGEGQAQSCLYQTSQQPNRPKTCDVVSSQAAMATGEKGAKDQYTRITFERRFTPGQTPTATDLQPGETFLGGQVMALAINPTGAVNGCRVVATSGSMLPEYGCDEASAERFQSGSRGQAAATEGYMMVLVYAHAEHVV